MGWPRAVQERVDDECAAPVDGPEDLLGRTLSLLGDGDSAAYDGTLGGDHEDRAGRGAAARALLRAGRTARIDIGGSAWAGIPRPAPPTSRSSSTPTPPHPSC